MSYLRHNFKILDDPTPNDANVVGNQHTVIPSDLDDVGDADQQWHVFVTLTQEGGDTSPTTDLTIETSFDGGSTWAKVAGAKQLTGDASQSELIQLEALGPRLRATKKLGGGTKPNSTAVVLLASNGLFKAADTGA